jgi:hypothetical protein
MAKPLATITNSEISAILDCPKKWDFRYKQRLVSRKPKGKLDLGSAMHDSIELFYKKPSIEITDLQALGLNMLEGMFQKHDEAGGWPYDEDEQKCMRELLNSMIEQYVLYAREHDDFKVVSLEEEFDIPAVNPWTGEVHEELRVMGKIDGWCKVNDHNFILEHKTAAGTPGADYWWPYLNQIDMYSYAMSRKHDVQFSGAYVNVIVKKIPSVPKALKKGGLSQAKDIMTTEEVYKAEIEKHGLDISEYEGILKTLRDKGNRFIARKPVYRNAEDLEQIERTIWWALNYKLNASFFPKNKSDKCSWKCGYKELCIDDLEEVRDHLFTVRDSEHAELSGGKNGTEV